MIPWERGRPRPLVRCEIIPGGRIAVRTGSRLRRPKLHPKPCGRGRPRSQPLAPRVFPHISQHVFSPVRPGIIALVSILTGSSTVAAVAPRGLLDHSLCCGVPPSAVDGSGGFFDPAADPVFSRRRLPPPGAAVDPPPAVAPAAVPPATVRPPANPGSPAAPAAIDPAIGVTQPGAESFEPLQMPTETVSGHLRVGFNVLGGFPFQLSKAEAATAAAPETAAAADVLARIPEVVRQLDGKKVLVSGFMLPMKMEGTLATEFLLVANSMLCCYGVVPPMNQWMVVQMKKAGVKPQQDVPVSFFGTLRVKPRFDGGALSAIYHLEGDRPHAP